MRYSQIDNKLFIQNRKRFTEQLKPKSLAFFNSNDEMPRNGDQNFSFRQNSDFFYLSGIDQEKSVLIIFPDCPVEKFREVLLLRETSETIAIWEGHKYTKDEATSTSGIKTVMWLDSLDAVIAEVMVHAENVYLNTTEQLKFIPEVISRDNRFTNDLKNKYPAHNYQRSAPILTDLRLIKSDIEISLMTEAINITEKAFRRVLKFVKPAVKEYEIQAEIEHEFILNRANGHAYHPIIASGNNANCLHYNENNDECKSGDLILLDFGAEYANYCADLSRTIPVNGKYSPRQKKVYNAVLKVQKAAIKLMVCGNTIDKLNVEVAKIMEKEMIKLGLFTKEDTNKQNAEKPFWAKYYPHGTSHFMGLDVH
ncbi:MAG: aminopeptidase P N-terminal domain-containing protein, partial [Bacteroidales bacterium]|nr:aminopeptidase P N-terminal domain-containing protein [Bacteroidales bacterium]